MLKTTKKSWIIALLKGTSILVTCFVKQVEDIKSKSRNQKDFWLKADDWFYREFKTPITRSNGQRYWLYKKKLTQLSLWCSVREVRAQVVRATKQNIRGNGKRQASCSTRQRCEQPVRFRDALRPQKTYGLLGTGLGGRRIGSRGEWESSPPPRSKSSSPALWTANSANSLLKQNP